VQVTLSGTQCETVVMTEADNHDLTGMALTDDDYAQRDLYKLSFWYLLRSLCSMALYDIDT
jgi:hypothetical protein